MPIYKDLLSQLYQAGFSQGKIPSLEIAQELNSSLDFPSSSYPVIHVAGSNGKGSVTTKIAKALELSGYKVGIYTSPHLFSFEERIAINSEPISQEEVMSGLRQLFLIAQRKKIRPSFFELTTFLAFNYFKKCDVAIAVIETGLGGRFDATNVVQPILSVITSISQEHTAILGRELESIAFEKAGIIKLNVPLILGPKARYQAIYDRARELNAPVFVSKKISCFFDEENIAIAQLALETLSSRFPLDPEGEKKGVHARPACRFERIGNAIFDGAHNPEAVFSLLQALHHFFPKSRFRFVVGFCKDKEYECCLDLIGNVATHIHLVQSLSERAASIEELKAGVRDKDPHLLTSHPSIREGVIAAYSEASSQGEILVVCGSFYIMAEAQPAVASLERNETILSSPLS